MVAEALSCGIPIITTKGTLWKDLNKYQAGALIDIGVDALKNTLEEYMQKSQIELMEMGKNGRIKIFNRVCRQEVQRIIPMNFR